VKSPQLGGPHPAVIRISAIGSSPTRGRPTNETTTPDDEPRDARALVNRPEVSVTFIVERIYDSVARCVKYCCKVSYSVTSET